MAESPPKTAPLNPSALNPDGLALVLTRGCGGRWRVTADDIRADVAAGAPAQPDGTLSLVAYCAWLLKERGRGS